MMVDITCSAKPGVLLGLKEAGSIIPTSGTAFVRSSTVTSTQSPAHIIVSEDDRAPTAYIAQDGQITNLSPVQRNPEAAYNAAGAVLADMGITCQHADHSPVRAITMNRNDAIGLVRGSGAPSK